MNEGQGQGARLAGAFLGEGSPIPGRMTRASPSRWRFPTTATARSTSRPRTSSVKGGKISAVINNVPRDVKTVRLGERIEVAYAQISDWMYMRAGKIVGNFTMRPLLKRMPPQDAARYRTMLADP